MVSCRFERSAKRVETLLDLAGDKPYHWDDPFGMHEHAANLSAFVPPTHPPPRSGDLLAPAVACDCTEVKIGQLVCASTMVCILAGYAFSSARGHTHD